MRPNLDVFVATSAAIPVLYVALAVLLRDQVRDIIEKAKSAAPVEPVRRPARWAIVGTLIVELLPALLGAAGEAVSLQALYWGHGSRAAAIIAVLGVCVMMGQAFAVATYELLQALVPFLLPPWLRRAGVAMGLGTALLIVGVVSTVIDVLR